MAASDLAHARRLAHPRALVVLDDCTYVEVWAAWQFALETGLLEALHPGLGWKGSCVGRFLPEMSTL